MYQKILAVFAVFLSLPAYAAQTKNTMKMVSYFPVPYVAYDTVSANNAMDIGILNQCAMDINKGSTNLGGSACSLYLYGNATGADLNRGLLNVAAGKLDLNSDVTNARIVSKKVQLGTSMTPENGWLDIGIPSGKNDEYDALYISSLKNTGNSFRVTSKEDGAKVNSFHMFNEISNDFPGCVGTVTWQELELAANVNSNETYTDIFLVCNGEGTTGGDECTDGEVSGTQSCNVCGEQTTKKCVNGKWTDSLGVCSKTIDECVQSCSPAFSSWQDISYAMQDTCPGGDSIAPFTCNGSYSGTCTDIQALPDDKDMGQTSVRDFLPPSGYVEGSSCSDTSRLEKKKIAAGFDYENLFPDSNYAIASCTDITSGSMVSNLPFGFHILKPGGGGIQEWASYGQIKECPSWFTGGETWQLCRDLCGVADDSNEGCKTRTRCYQAPSMNGDCGNLTSGSLTTGNGFVIHTCEPGDGGRRARFKLTECGFKYQKRTVTCCG